MCHADQWTIADTGSRQGTRVNGRALEAGQPCLLAPGDLIELGRWSCRYTVGLDSERSVSFVPPPSEHEHVSTIVRPARGMTAQTHLDALIALSREYQGATSIEDVARATVEAIQSSTDCSRIAVVKRISESAFEALATSGSFELQLSRSLVDGAARAGDLAELRRGADLGAHAQSICEMDIRSAICAPVMVSRSPEAFLYLDTRRGESALPDDAAVICRAVSELAGLALERVMGAALAERHADLEKDLTAARDAQRFLMPPAQGLAGPVEYAYESLAGRVVAGDLFDIFALDEHRTAVFLGDVAGKGVGAAVLMAAVQTQMRTRLLTGAPLSEAVGAVNKDLYARTAPDKFVTLMGAVIDRTQSSVEIVDAGHGFGVIARSGCAPQPVETPGEVPLGIDPDANYTSASFEFPELARLVLFSDGVIEQADLQGTHFGFERAVGLIEQDAEPTEIASSLRRAVQEHADAPLSDDLTIAAVQRSACPDGHRG